jgi:hypothetical protein
VLSSRIRDLFPAPSRASPRTNVLFIPDDFEARSGDELNLTKGDKVELLELDDGFGDGWYLGKSLVSGVTGLFPGGNCSSLPHRRTS